MYRRKKRILPVLTGFLLLVLSVIAGSRAAGAASWAEPAYVTLSGNVKLSGDKTTNDIKSGQFQFKVTSESEEPQLPERSNHVDAGGKLPLGSYTFTEEGNYRLKIQQVKGNAQGYIYDMDVVTVDIRITKNTKTNRMESAVTYRKSGQIVSGISFTNTYTEEKDEAPVPEQQSPAEPAAAEPSPASEPERETVLAEGLEAEFKSAEEAVVPGGETTFSMQFVNTGDTVLEGLYIRQYVPDYMLYVKCEENGSYGAIDGAEHATWFIEALKPGEIAEVWLTCRLYICLPDDVKIMSSGYYEVTGLSEEVLTNDPEDPAIELNESAVKIEAGGVRADE